MGYFDALASSSFKQVGDRRLFYPWGVLGQGYAIPNESKYLEIYAWVKRYLRISLALVIVIGAVAGWIWTLPLIPISMFWYFFKIRTFTRGLETVTERMTLADSYRAQAQRHNLVTLWLLGAAAVMFVIGGIVLLALEPRRWLIPVASIAFFGACAVAIGFMIAIRIKKSN